MTGEPVNPNSIPHSPLQEQITDAVLWEKIGHFEGWVDRFESAVDLTLELVAGFQAFDGRIGKIVTPGGEEITDPQIVEAGHGVAVLAVSQIERPLDEFETAVLSLPTVIDKATLEERRALFATFPPSELAVITATKGSIEGSGENMAHWTKRSNRSWRDASRVVDLALAESRKDGALLTAKGSFEILEPIRVANDFIHTAKKTKGNHLDSYSEQVNEHIAQFMRDCPSMVSVDYLSLRAYAATIRTLRDCRDDEKVGLFTPEARQVLKDTYGFSDENIYAHEAARILSLANRPAVPGLSEDGDYYGVYELPIFKIFNIAPTADKVVPSFKTDIVSNAQWIPPEKQPAIAAQEVMHEVIRRVAPSEPWKNIVNATRRLEEEGLGKIMRPAIIRDAQEFIEGVKPIHKDLIDAAFAIPLNHENLAQAQAAENYIINRLSEIAEDLKQTALGEVAPAATQLEIPPVINEYVKAINEAAQLEEIDAFCDASRQEIAKLDEPYNYTSKRIRSYENGPVTLSSLKQALDKRDVLVDEDARRTLAIMMLQSEQADDPVAYFEELRDTRDLIELYLSDMNYLGQKGQANVTNVLRWVDEMINAGLENSVDHARLKQFIQNYYLGIEEATETEAESAEPPEPKKNSKKDYNRAAQEYVDYYAEVLEGVDVEFSDVTFFTKKSRGTSRRVSEGRIRSPGEAPVNVDKNRLAGLVKLKNEFERDGKSARLIITEPTRSKRIPYMALYVQEHPGDPTGVCFMENVEVNTATYCLTVDGNYVRDWDELADYTLKEWSEEWGAKSYVHPVQDTPYFAHHYTLKLKKHAITELAKLRQYQ